MLCRINPTVGGATDERARALNFLRALQAICTAAAGSTPTCPSQTGPTASPSGTDVILEVISNTEAGGWTSSSSTNITSNYNASFASPYQLDLWRDSGKAVYPFRKMSFRTNPYYMFSSGYTSYPNIMASHGFNTANDASGGYLLGTTINNTATGTTNAFKMESVYWDNDVNSNTYLTWLQPNQGEMLIASTDRYFICITGNVANLTGFQGNFTYMGLRQTQAWEDQYDDNPPICSLTYHGGQWWSSIAGFATMWARTINSNGTVNSSPSWYKTGNSAWGGAYNSNPGSNGTNIDPLTGWNNTNSGLQNFTFPSIYYGNEMQIPMLPHTYSMVTKRQDSQSHWIPPVTDPATGVFVSPAFPITFARNKNNSFNPGGNAFGVYKGFGGSDAWLSQYWVSGQNYIINNEAYYSYGCGHNQNYRDVFLVRKA
jgi:hypothetical protein